MRLSGWLLFTPLIILCACNDKGQSIDRAGDSTFKGTFPAVLRSVLDRQPRMVSVRLGTDHYIAYDAETCAPSKVWRGGIALNGAAYNDIKTVQPETWGQTYLEFDKQTPFWTFQEGGDTFEADASFKGYELIDGLPKFAYSINMGNDQQARLKESVSFDHGEDGSARLIRTYRIEDLPEGITVYAGSLALDTQNATQAIDILPAIEKPEPPSTEVIASTGPAWLDRSGCNTCHAFDKATIGPSYRQIAARYEQDSETRDLLTAKVLAGGSGNWGKVPMNPHPQLDPDDVEDMVKYILTLDPDPEGLPVVAAQSNNNPPDSEPELPGFGVALQGVHPAFDVQTILPEGFKPRVGGMDFMSDGRLVLCTWDSIGGVYILENVESGVPDRIKVSLFAAGLHEPLGLKVVEDEIYVLQKQELTKLLDHDGDGQADEYRAICNSFQVSADFHEFSYGLAWRDGYFYATLGVAMRLMANEEQLEDRGTTIRISEDGHFDIVNRGMRQPNGIGYGVDNELFVLENQGQWVPASKLVQVREGDFHGCRFGDGGRFEGWEVTPPAVWLPQNEIGNSPSEPVPLDLGPYQNQMLHGEVTHGGLKRVFLEKINGAYQGAVFRFSQGFEAGVNRLAWGPDGALYVGEVGMNGNWGWGPQQFGLQRMSFNGDIPFEMLEVRATSKGLDITFTEALARGQGEMPEDYQLQQWRYEITPAYGGPKLDVTDLPVQSVSLSSDRKTASLEVPGIKEGYIVYILLHEGLQSESSLSLWTGEAWYTMNAIPK